MANPHNRSNFDDFAQSRIFLFSVIPAKANQRRSLANQRRSLANQRRSLANQRRSLANQRRSLANQRRSLANQRRSLAGIQSLQYVLDAGSRPA
jgi:septal ring factor EnvC (AmiA/AmiB activator)